MLPTRPEYNDGIPPSLPEDLTGLDDASLIELMRVLVAWQEYVGVRVARAETIEAEAATAVAGTEAIALIEGWGGVKEDRVGIAKARRDTDPKLVVLRDKYDNARAFRKLSQALYEGLERKSFVVSRELTRRVGMEPVQRRKHKHGGA